MSLEQTTTLYASVLRQLLPEGVYDTADSTNTADDIWAHAKVLAQADIDAHRLLGVLEAIPVELLSDYEREYGLPLKCMLADDLAIEQRIEILRWVRFHRNVMNREYLEQLLAVFGVTLVNVRKYYPMQCTGTCIDPVNTEHLRFKVLLEMQYPMTADMSCIIENYLPGYLRVDWRVDMPWGEWILNSGYTLVGNNIRYTGYKTNQRDYYDSYADFDLVTALVRSFHDEDMQQWQGFVDAANELTGVTDWVVDVNNSNIVYSPQASGPCETFASCNTYEFLYKRGTSYNTSMYGNECASSNAKHYRTLKEAFLEGYRCVLKVYPNYTDLNTCQPSGDEFLCYHSGGNVRIGKVVNPAYDPSASNELSYVSFNTLAEKIKSNVQNINEAISIHAENYVYAVANSIFDVNPNKQFIKLSDLISQFENNKVLRV